MKYRAAFLPFALMVSLLACTTTGYGQTPTTVTTLYTFSGGSPNYSADLTPAFPYGSLLQGSDGNFYGTTEAGGTALRGTVFQITPSGALTVLHNFSETDGSDPYSSLIQGADGSFYGTTYYGGKPGEGTIFRITAAGVFTSLYNFSAATYTEDGHYLNNDGVSPEGLVLGSDGNFYGVTADGGTGKSGTVFQMTLAWVVTTLHTFSALDSNQTNGDGSAPRASLVQGSDGSLYGTTGAGGPGGTGTVFKITTAGALTILHSFDPIDVAKVNAGGAQPYAPLLQGSDGNFYGTTTTGGPGGTGTFFQITPAGSLTTLHNFSALDINDANSDGANPRAALILGSDGNFYGLTQNGGPGRTGTAFKITPGGVLTTFYGFGNVNSNDYNEDGANPEYALCQAADGNFYGTTTAGGLEGAGVVFKLTPDGTLSNLRNFTTTRYNFYNGDGDHPSTGLIQTSDGNFFGSTDIGGSGGQGTIFKLTPTGDLITLYNFSAVNGHDANSDGAALSGGIIRATDGNFYGTTFHGGAAGLGTVFKITADGAFTSLLSFTGTDGDAPFASLVQASDGNFYGLTSRGGTSDDGTAFKITPAGQLTTLHHFNGNDGAEPQAALIQGSDGNFYGMTSKRGPGGYGTVFQMTPAGVVTTLHNFSAVDKNGANADGAAPRNSLIQASDGNFYGMTDYGGTGGTGTVFTITAQGALTTLHSFSHLDSNQQNIDGSYPAGKLLQLSDGNFYGTAEFGGVNTYGTIFKITPAGVLTVLHSFGYNSDEGANPNTGLIVGSDGNIYGTTDYDGSEGSGTVYRLTLGSDHPAFFTGEAALANGVYYLAFPNGDPFGYYSYLTDPHYIYHFDLGFEYIFDASDGKSGVYFYDFKSNGFFYSSPGFPFPYLYDFSLNSVVYYYPDPNNAGHYNTNGIRYFYEFNTGQIISK